LLLTENIIKRLLFPVNMADKQQEIQAKYMQFQQLQAQIKQINEHLEKISERIQEVDTVIQAIKDVSEIKEGSEVLVPVSNGVFIKANTKNTNEFLVNVGSKSVVKKDREGVEKLLERQKEELAELQMTMMNDLNTAETSAVELQQELQTIMGQ